MVNESVVWSQVERCVKSLEGEAERMEDKARADVPDVAWALSLTCSGWLELKDVVGAKPVKIGLRGPQAMFLRKWSRTGRAGVLARVLRLESPKRGVSGHTEWCYWAASPGISWAVAMTSTPFLLPHRVVIADDLPVTWFRDCLTGALETSASPTPRAHKEP